MNKTIAFARAGAIFYLIWGLLHFNAAYEVYRIGSIQTQSIVQGRLYQSAWNLAFFAFTATVVSIWLNWRNDRTGYWIALFVISVTDIGFLLFVLLPGYLPWIPGLLGPVFWILGLIATTWARVSANGARDANATVAEK